MADKSDGHAPEDKPVGRSPEELREMAKHARKMAEGLATEANRQQMLEIANYYERLAKEAEEQEQGKALVERKP